MKTRRKLFFWKLIEREGAVRYLMISLFSFVATIGVVRTFLALTGYPQIGSGTLHIAHVLWGGLILYIAAILPLIYMNPRLHYLGAVLAGVGMGLFLDEVGKFITRQYDYFFPAAAPIMYVFFLLIIVLAIMIRRPEAVDGRTELVKTLEIVREQLYRPLDTVEREHVEADLNRVLETDKDSLHQDLARRLLDIIRSDTRTAPVEEPVWWRRFITKVEAWLTEVRLLWLIGAGMVLLGFMTLKNPLQVWLGLALPDSTILNFFNAHFGRQISPVDAPSLYGTRLILEVVVGLLLFVSAILLAMGKKRPAINLGYLSLLISLTVLDMLLFYFEQFSTVFIVLVQFLVLFGIIFYRRRYLQINT
ncbi:MAG: hypothetical protein C3F13_13550 [Anaerolineales bacterium]|nr:hypothetical protein [Anaerolineae bacterium]PWB51462.1 MAG: hypothetical protein C3F13_13550 [Anaerolineales bacterium]